MIRLTGGVWRGRTLPTLEGLGVRPTSGRVREAVYSLVGHNLHGWSMLDLCGGSGAMALEAASRGASPVTVVERSAGVAAAIRQAATRLQAELRVRCGDSLKLDLEPADFVYIDPPYREAIGPWLERGVQLGRRVVVAEAREGAS